MTLTFPNKMSAEAVANLHKVIRRDGNVSFLPNIEKCKDKTSALYNKILSSKGASQTVVMPAEEWLVDNYHIIHEQYENVISYLKKCRKYSFRGMPIISGRDGEALRIYDIAAYITEVYDARIDETCLREFLDEYQTVAALTSAEISNLGEMLRIALLVKIADVCDSAEKINRERNEAEKIFERLNKFLDESEVTPAERKRAIDIWISSTEELTPVLAETVLRLAASVNGDTAEYRAIFDLKLAGRKTSVDKMLTAERNSRTSLGIMMGNAVRTLAALASFDWDTLSSELCSVERILDNDPSGVFPLMDRDSRSYYIRCTENIARRANVSAVSVAIAAVERAEEFCCEGCEDFKSHVGYYLCDDGVRELSGKVHKGFRVKMPKRPRGVVASAAFMACSAVSTSVLTFITAVIVAVVSVAGRILHFITVWNAQYISDS